MYKIKTKSAAKKRFRKSGGKAGKIKRARAYRRHLLTKKDAKRKGHLRKGTYVSEADYAAIAKLLG